MNEETAIETEYRILWDYYKKSIDERVELFTWYFRIVTLPAVLFGLASFFKATSLKQVNGEDLMFVVGLIFGMIFLAGITLYITYTLMCNNVVRLEKRIGRIRKHIRSTSPQLDQIFGNGDIEVERQINPFVGVKFWRGAIIPIVNSATCAGAVSLLQIWNHHLLWPYFFSFFGHILIFGLVFKRK